MANSTVWFTIMGRLYKVGLSLLPHLVLSHSIFENMLYKATYKEQNSGTSNV